MRRVSLQLQKDLLNLQGASKRLKSVRMSRWHAGASRVDGCCLGRQGENAEQLLKPSYKAETGIRMGRRERNLSAHIRLSLGEGWSNKKILISNLIKRQKECQSLWTQRIMEC